MMFPKKDLDLLLVPSGLVIMFTYHLFFLYKYRHSPETTVMGVENVDRRAWVEGIIKLTLDKRTFATNVISSSVTAATFLASVSLTLSSLLGAWIASSTVGSMFRLIGGLGDLDPSTTAIKYMSLLACFILAFAFFLQSARHFIHANYLVTTQDDSISKEDMKVVIIRGGEFLSLGLRAIYFALALLLWFFGPVPMFATSAILVMILYHHDIHSIPLARPHQLKARLGGVQ
ncbi:uncharacterized protein LOC115739707 [Rhodamnia argentea]|uniref:Uncharacterized protein LOC115739707 n=1 Tax=Rhodamnia argentea TaxID=178133 RepID=A0A8B8P1S9_9MYRT|nr:uncharacterized protein LOC115739707 [Rhodamnia argentea]